MGSKVSIEFCKQLSFLNPALFVSDSVQHNKRYRYCMKHGTYNTVMNKKYNWPNFTFSYITGTGLTGVKSLLQLRLGLKISQHSQNFKKLGRNVGE